MELSKNLKKIMLVGSAILMFASVGAGTGNLTANARRRYHPRIVRRYRRRPVRRVRRYCRRVVRRHVAHVSTKGVNAHNEWSKHPSKAQLAYFAKHALHVTNKDGTKTNDPAGGLDYAKLNRMSLRKAYFSIMKDYNGNSDYQKYERKEGSINNNKINVVASNYAVKYLNKIRAEHGVNTLGTDPRLTKIAYQRAAGETGVPESQEATCHDDKNGNTYMADLANEEDIPLNDNYGENVGMTSSRGEAMSDTKTNNPNANKVSRYMGHGVDAFMNDKPHRDNSLSSDWNWVGIGIANNGDVVEDFEG